jgi:hypothetical protein
MINQQAFLKSSGFPVWSTLKQYKVADRPHTMLPVVKMLGRRAIRFIAIEESPDFSEKQGIQGSRLVKWRTRQTAFLERPLARRGCPTPGIGPFSLSRRGVSYFKITAHDRVIVRSGEIGYTHREYWQSPLLEVKRFALGDHHCARSFKHIGWVCGFYRRAIYRL